LINFEKSQINLSSSASIGKLLMVLSFFFSAPNGSQVATKGTKKKLKKNQSTVIGPWVI